MQNSLRRRSQRAGFTMIELLTVIGIIIVLIGILIPLVTTARKKAQEANTFAQINKLQAAAQNYYTEFRSYPGPVPDQNIKGYYSSAYVPPDSGVAPIVLTPTSAEITSSENLVLGLVGGLYYGSSAASTPGIQYDPLYVGKGVRNLTLNNPQMFPTYIDLKKGDLSDDGKGNYVSWTKTYNSVAGVFVIPEFMDMFTNSNPIIYLRARAGGQEICENSDAQYFSNELGMYWIGNSGPTAYPYSPFPSKLDPAYNNTSLYALPTDFFKNPSILDGRTPRGRDMFIMISAGYDGIYGTKDDILFPSN